MGGGYDWGHEQTRGAGGDGIDRGVSRGGTGERADEGVDRGGCDPDRGSAALHHAADVRGADEARGLHAGERRDARRPAGAHFASRPGRPGRGGAGHGAFHRALRARARAGFADVGAAGDAGAGADRAGDERQNVASRGDAEQREASRKTGRDFHRAGGGNARVRVRGTGAAVARAGNRAGDFGAVEMNFSREILA